MHSTQLKRVDGSIWCHRTWAHMLSSDAEPTKAKSYNKTDYIFPLVPYFERVCPTSILAEHPHANVDCYTLFVFCMPCTLYKFLHLGIIYPTPANWRCVNTDGAYSKEDINFEDEFFDSIRPIHLHWTRATNTLMHGTSGFEIVAIIKLQIIIL